MHPREKAQIEAARATAGIDKSICARCGTKLQKSGVIYRTSEMVFAVCENCKDPAPGGPHEVIEREIYFGLVKRYLDGKDHTQDTRIVRPALDLGMKVSTGRGEEVLASFSAQSSGWSGDGDSAPSWYSTATRRWKIYVVRDRDGNLKRTEQLRCPLMVR